MTWDDVSLRDVVDVTKASPARVYDYWLNGTHNFEVDRELARLMETKGPCRNFALRNREFVRRTVRLMREQGVRQFVDIGSGIPTVGNVHEIAQADDPSVDVVYVDNDIVAAKSSQLMLRGNDHVVAIHEDLRRPERILAHPEVAALIDLSEPVGFVLGAVVHFLRESDDPAAILRVLHDAAAPGSMLALSHGTARDAALAAEVADQYDATEPLVYRSHEHITRLFGAWELLPPGLVWVPDWRPDPLHDTLGTEPAYRSEDCWTYGGVGVRR